MSNKIEPNKIGLKVAEAFTLAHLLVANAILILGETTSLIEIGTKIYGAHPGARFVLEILDAPFYLLLKNRIETSNDPTVYFILTELVIMLASFGYGLLCYIFVRFIFSAFRPDLK